jgi:exosortase/archaeosortase family protein
MVNLYKIFFRYLILFFIGWGNLYIFYKLFTYPTIILSNSFLSFFDKAQIIDNYIFFGDNILEVANACIAGSAYYLLFILSMSIPLEFLKRIKVIIYSFSIFFFINILRIVLMALILKTSFFQGIHLFMWHIFSTILIVLIWFSAIKIFNIAEIPFYTDFLFIKKTKNSKTKKKYY